MCLSVLVSVLCSLLKILLWMLVLLNDNDIMGRDPNTKDERTYALVNRHKVTAGVMEGNDVQCVHNIEKGGTLVTFK
jgi:hypothetical protein